MASAVAALLFTASQAAAQVRRVQATPAPPLPPAVAPVRVPAEPPADPWFAVDKLQHFTGSYALTVFAHAAASTALSSRDALYVAVPAAALAGIAKEVYDRRAGGFFSSRDLAADALGVAVAWLILREVR